MNWMQNNHAISLGCYAGENHAPFQFVAAKWEKHTRMNVTTHSHSQHGSSGKSFAINDAPLITPTFQTRMSISKALISENNLPNPPLLVADHDRSPPPQNPLDLLSTVSTQVLADKENRFYTNEDNNNGNNSQHLNYAGEIDSLGRRHGRGIMLYPNGCRYNGCFVDDRRHGFGECRYPNGCVYVGFWSWGRRDGVGRMTYADRGDVYEGEWRSDGRHGIGTYFRSDGRADVCRYASHDAVGEGVQWSPNRGFAVLLVDGANRGPIRLERALEICERMGLPGAPRQTTFPSSAFFDQESR